MFEGVDRGSVRQLIWQTFVCGLVVSSEWKGNSDRGLVLYEYLGKEDGAEVKVLLILL